MPGYLSIRDAERPVNIRAIMAADTGLGRISSMAVNTDHGALTHLDAATGRKWEIVQSLVGPGTGMYGTALGQH